uniref:Uncharacterized protein n=1 Tax=Anguilla anguilla TaxID=7936 RepID=A0A0E9V486_ANGAN
MAQLNSRFVAVCSMRFDVCVCPCVCVITNSNQFKQNEHAIFRGI